MVRFFRWAIVACGIVVLTASAANAQAIGQIFGKVTDATGGVLPGVTVTVTGTGLQQPLVFVTTHTGAYTFPNVPIGTYTVSFELSGFKKVSRQNIVITSGFAASIDAKMEVGAVSTEVNVSAAPPVVDTKRTTTGGTFTSDVMENVPTARDPWQVINMAPGVELSGYNVGGSASGQQLTPSVYGTSSSVQWNLEGGNITDMSSNSSPEYFNFDSFEEIQVVTGGGDVSVQSSGLFINLVTKSGSNVFKGTGTVTFENASMQAQNVTQALFTAGGSRGTGLSGNPLHKIGNYSAEFGGPIMRNRLWFWGAWDYQDINVGVANFFDTNKSGCNPPPSTFDQLSQVQGCLTNDQTSIKDYNLKINYQLNAANKFQYLFGSDNKVRNHRSASSTTAPEATYAQYSPGKYFPDPNHQLTHTLILTDKLVFTNQMTYVRGGFFLDATDWSRCGSSSYARMLANQIPTDPTCLYNTQPLQNRTTGYLNRSDYGYLSYQTQRPGWEVKTDGNYFLSNVLGGDHALKFGVGWRKNPVLTFTHGSGGGAAAEMQCPGNLGANCPSAQPSSLGSYIAGLVPYQARLYRDRLTNYDWWTWSSYLQDSYSHGRWRINGGVRQDWQNSTFLGGTVPANVVNPTILPAQTQGTADPHQAFDNFSPRVSVTYDVFGNGKTQVHGSFSYYYATQILLANGLSNLGGITLTYGSNQSSGACSTTANASCWTDSNHDGIVQANELIGIPSASTSRFNQTTGVLTNVAPTIDPNLQIGRTREGIVGVQHELMANVAVGADYIYRYYDHGSTTYLQGYQPGAAGYPLSNLYVGPYTYTDPTTGTAAPYYTICQGCTRPTGSNITVTYPGHSTYKGLELTLQRRMSHRWQAQASLTLNNSQTFNLNDGNPTGFTFSNGYNTDKRYLIKALASAQLWWGINVGANLNWTDGPTRGETINGPGQVYGGTSGTISYSTLTFQPSNIIRYPAVKLLDLSASKVVSMRGGKDRVTLTLDCFNIFNINTITAYGSGNLDSTSFTAVNSIIAPRVFRVGARIAF